MSTRAESSESSHSPLPLSRREKSAVVTLLVSLAVYGAYFGGVLFVGPNPEIGTTLALFFGALFVLAVSSIIAHVALVGGMCPGKGDERDAQVELVAYRNAYWALMWSPWFTLPAALSWAGAGSQTAAAPLVLIGQALFACLVVSEITKLTTRVVMYRRGR